MAVRVAMPGLWSDFRTDTGEGTQRYSSELYGKLSKAGGISVSKVAYRRRTYFLAHMMLDDFAKYDIVHMPNFRLLYPLRRGKAATLVTAHDFQPLIAPGLDMKHDYSPYNRLWFGLNKLDMRRMLLSDYMICNSTLTRDDAVRLGYDRGRTFVTPLGIDDRFRAARKRGRRDGRTFKVGYLGGFRARKNVPSAIRAFRRLEGKGIEFEVWGKRSYEYDYLADLARGDRRIRFMGFAPESRIVDIYDSFDAFVFPSLYEGFGFPILEAQARGLPVIIYKKAKIPEEVRRHCLEAKDEGHMAGLLDGIRRNGYKGNPVGYARSFTWGRTAGETARIYGKIGAR